MNKQQKSNTNNAQLLVQPEDKSLQEQLKYLDELKHDIIIFPDNICAIGLQVSPLQLANTYRHLISGQMQNTTDNEVPEEARKHFRDSLGTEGIAIKIHPIAVHISFYGTQSPEEAIKNIIKSQNKMTEIKRGVAAP
ncbi:hypothetical protein EY011_11765 [Shigella flexneri]|uniref:Uncharacterized protein n=1 Tax=Escherichia coli TaxID=562 RepID=A0A376FPU3_ECOLX|nr:MULTISPECIES: hypothetical protein [Enterobacteriaceae]EFX2138602.1 hypothetical protein [Shigella flexneri]EFZ60628.1 hypothetical protein ECLT68_0570 [Escherichia coli LT-68]EFK4081723.1 hypothetical protein [Escherichia coli]EFK6612140.1 hypothetical protein [Escherichia coli]EGF7274090.1 hypothetical protein [Shigella flexneri]